EHPAQAPDRPRHSRRRGDPGRGRKLFLRVARATESHAPPLGYHLPAGRPVQRPDIGGECRCPAPAVPAARQAGDGGADQLQAGTGGAPRLRGLLPRGNQRRHAEARGPGAGHRPGPRPALFRRAFGGPRPLKFAAPRRADRADQRESRRHRGDRHPRAGQHFQHRQQRGVSRRRIPHPAGLRQPPDPARPQPPRPGAPVPVPGRHRARPHRSQSMSRSANPVAIGLFALITLVLAATLVVLFGGGDWWSTKERYVLLYDSSIRGLNVGAPVTLKGVAIGQVIDTRVTLYGETSDILNTVANELDPSALEYQGRDDKPVPVDDLLKRGRRAQLRQQSLLTGLLYVDVDFDPGKPATYKPVKTDHPQLPTTPTNLQQLTRDLESVDVNRLASDLQQTLSGINRLLNDPAMQQLAGNVGSAVKALETTAIQLGEVGEGLGRDYSARAHSATSLLESANRDMPALVTKLD